MHLLISKQLLMFPETEELTSSESGTRSRATRAPGEHTGKAFESGKGPDGFWAGGNKAEDRWPGECSVELPSVQEMAQRNGGWRWYWGGASEVTPGLGFILIKAVGDSA